MLIPVRKLYILIRTDMASMTTGRIAAQASHASNQFVHDYNYDIERLSKNAIYAEEVLKLKTAYQEWIKQTGRGFGTVIVKDGGTEKNIRQLLNKIPLEDYTHAPVIDPEYAIKDGETVHLVENVLTCAYIFPIHNRDNYELSHLDLL